MRILLCTGLAAAVLAGFLVLDSPSAPPAVPLRPTKSPDHAAPARAAAALGALRQAAERVRPLHRRKRPPRSGDWMSGPGRDESGQTFEEYIGSRPTTARGKRRVIYIRVIGELTTAQRSVVEPTIEFLGLYFGLPVKILDAVAVDEDWPYFARRELPGRSGPQLLTSYIRMRVLGPDLPDDGAVLLGLTAFDLWPGQGWNFVFGEASLEQRVGVWSIHRYGDPALGDPHWRRCLLRTLKVATHETGHMFSLEHCRAYECNMCGSNSLPETDRSPLALCPECLPKVCFATGVDPLKRYSDLAIFCRKRGLIDEAVFYEDSHRALRSR